MVSHNIEQIPKQQCQLFLVQTTLLRAIVDYESYKFYIYNCSVCEKFQTTRAKVAPVNLIYGSHFSATEATYKVSLKMVNFEKFTRIRRKPVPV